MALPIPEILADIADVRASGDRFKGRVVDGRDRLTDDGLAVRIGKAQLNLEFLAGLNAFLGGRNLDVEDAFHGRNANLARFLIESPFEDRHSVDVEVRLIALFDFNVDVRDSVLQRN